MVKAAWRVVNVLKSVLPASPPARIPSTLHFVWVGTEVPGWVEDRWDYWEQFCKQHHPDVQFRYWTDVTTQDQLPLTNLLRRYLSHPVLLADFARIEAVARYGGIYVDCDFWPLRPLDTLLDRPKGWAISLPDVEQDRIRREVSNALFGFSPWHPFLALMWHRGLSRLNSSYKKVISYCGPPAWTAVYQENPNLIEVLPNRLGFPTRPEQRYMIGLRPEDVAIAHPDSILWHEYEQSWQSQYKGRLAWRP